jgi:hypothetical protein
VIAGLGEPVDHGGEAGRQQGQANHVEVRTLLGRGWRKVAPRQPETSHAERDVDPEDPVPRELAQDHAADDRTEDRPEQSRKADQGHHLPEVAWACGIDEQSLEDGQHQATADALQHPEGDKGLDVPGEAREHRPDREEGEGGHPGLLGAEAIHGPGAHRDHHGEREHVGADDPLGRRHRRVQLSRECVDRHIDDRRVEHDRHRPDEQGHRKLQEPWIESFVLRWLFHVRVRRHDGFLCRWYLLAAR